MACLSRRPRMVANMTTNEHTLKFFGEELKHLKAEVALMGGLVEQQVADSIRAVANQKLDQLQVEIEKKAIRMIALRQPVAQDLRRTVAAMKLAWNLERTGDQAKNIAKRALIIAEAEPITPLTRSVERMGKLVVGRLKTVLDAYNDLDLEQALAVWQKDQEVDEHYNSLFRELLTYMMSDPRMIGACAQLLFVAKNLERIGDHATNVAEMIYYEVTGEEIVGDRPRWTGREDAEADGDAA
jgi:phosphate transport system protein